MAMRYKKLFDEKKLMAIDDELRFLIGTEKVRPPVEDENKRKKDGYSRIEGKAAQEYGISHATVARLIRINELCDELKKLVDTGNIKIRPAVELSYLSTDVQKSCMNVCPGQG